MGGTPGIPPSYTDTDFNALQICEDRCLEPRQSTPPIVITSTQWTAADWLGFLQARLNQFLRETGIVVARFGYDGPGADNSIDVTPNQEPFALPQNMVDVLRLAFVNYGKATAPVLSLGWVKNNDVQINVQNPESPTVMPTFSNPLVPGSVVTVNLVFVAESADPVGIVGGNITDTSLGSYADSGVGPRTYTPSVISVAVQSLFSLNAKSTPANIVTVDVTSLGSSNIWIQVIEWAPTVPSPVATMDGVAVGVKGGTSSGGSFPVGPLTTTVNGDLITGWANAASGDFAPGPGFSGADPLVFGSPPNPVDGIFKTQSGAGAITPSWSGSSGILYAAIAMAFKPGGTPIPTVLPVPVKITEIPREDFMALDASDSEWENTDEFTPTGYTQSITDTLQGFLANPPTDIGAIDLTFVPLGPTLTGAGVKLPIPNVCFPYLIWGALIDVFSQDGEAYNPRLAEYCELRWQEGIQLTRALLTAPARLEAGFV